MTEVITVCDNLSQNAKFSLSMPFAFYRAGGCNALECIKQRKNNAGQYSNHSHFAKLRLILTDNTEICFEIANL